MEIADKLIKEEFDKLVLKTNEDYATSVLISAFQMLGKRKLRVDEGLSPAQVKNLNTYKFPERVVKLMKVTTGDFTNEDMFNSSFTKFALTHTELSI